ncbi:glycosyltransferase family 4 protein [Desulfosarcina ovata]|uniref:Glycosyl transferase group 1 n=1 Tax=Desulfosarcina ovata subsp. ovata TaxID=2752305 RepID=A0A5K8A7S5_9BACT|nr:glycosyltransferase family 4 protein [Desulfosarcina ovata]BBO88516.1 glycosyl transferase group 1 [Desulfosarcina ovata subsp. ovata]
MLKVTTIASGDLWAGAEVMIWQLIGQLRRYRDVELSVLLLNENRLAAEIRSLGVHVDIIDESKHTFIPLFWKTRNLIKSNAPDIIHAHRYKENLLAFLAGGVGNKAVLITTQHGMSESTVRQGIGARIKSRINQYLLGHQFNSLVGVSKNISGFFINDCRANPKNVCILHNGIKLPPYQLPTTRQYSVAGSAGRFFPVKDYTLLVEIAKCVTNRDKNIRFEIAGDGPERPKLETQISKYSLDGAFHLRGHQHDMAPFYRGLDIYINTSVHEGIPMSILEAMSHGLPVVAPKVGGIVEIIDDGIDGFLIPTRKPEDFAEKILLLQNFELRMKMGLAARKKVEQRFSAEHMAQQYYELYRQLAERPS